MVDDFGAWIPDQVGNDNGELTYYSVRQIATENAGRMVIITGIFRFQARSVDKPFKNVI